MSENKKLKVTLVKSPIGFNGKQGRVVQSMGLRRIRITGGEHDLPVRCKNNTASVVSDVCR